MKTTGKLSILRDKLVNVFGAPECRSGLDRPRTWISHFWDQKIECCDGNKGFDVNQVVNTLGYPTAIAFLSDNRMMVAEMLPKGKLDRYRIAIYEERQSAQNDQ